MLIDIISFGRTAEPETDPYADASYLAVTIGPNGSTVYMGPSGVRAAHLNGGEACLFVTALMGGLTSTEIDKCYALVSSMRTE